MQTNGDTRNLGLTRVRTQFVNTTNLEYSNLGWARVRTQFKNPLDEFHEQLKLYSDCSFYGKIPCANFHEVLIFNEFPFISRSYFLIRHDPPDRANYYPAFIHVFGANGLYVNKTSLTETTRPN
jgi:hypothetical protein